MNKVLCLLLPFMVLSSASAHAHGITLAGAVALYTIWGLGFVLAASFIYALLCLLGAIFFKVPKYKKWIHVLLVLSLALVLFAVSRYLTTV